MVATIPLRVCVNKSDQGSHQTDEPLQCDDSISSPENCFEGNDERSLFEEDKISRYRSIHVQRPKGLSRMLKNCGKSHFNPDEVNADKTLVDKPQFRGMSGHRVEGLDSEGWRFHGHRGQVKAPPPAENREVEGIVGQGSKPRSHTSDVGGMPISRQGEGEDDGSDQNIGTSRGSSQPLDMGYFPDAVNANQGVRETWESECGMARDKDQSMDQERTHPLKRPRLCLLSGTSRSGEQGDTCRSAVKGSDSLRSPCPLAKVFKRIAWVEGGMSYLQVTPEYLDQLATGAALEEKEDEEGEGEGNGDAMAKDYMSKFNVYKSKAQAGLSLVLRPHPLPPSQLCVCSSLTHSPHKQSPPTGGGGIEGSSCASNGGGMETGSRSTDVTFGCKVVPDGQEKEGEQSHLFLKKKRKAVVEGVSVGGGEWEEVMVRGTKTSASTSTREDRMTSIGGEADTEPSVPLKKKKVLSRGGRSSSGQVGTAGVQEGEGEGARGEPNLSVNSSSTCLTSCSPHDPMERISKPSTLLDQSCSRPSYSGSSRDCVINGSSCPEAAASLLSMTTKFGVTPEVAGRIDVKVDTGGHSVSVGESPGFTTQNETKSQSDHSGVPDLGCPVDPSTFVASSLDEEEQQEGSVLEKDKGKMVTPGHQVYVGSAIPFANQRPSMGASPSHLPPKASSHSPLYVALNLPLSLKDVSGRSSRASGSSPVKFVAKETTQSTQKCASAALASHHSKMGSISSSLWNTSLGNGEERTTLQSPQWPQCSMSASALLAAGSVPMCGIPTGIIASRVSPHTVNAADAGAVMTSRSLSKDRQPSPLSASTSSGSGRPSIGHQTGRAPPPSSNTTTTTNRSKVSPAYIAATPEVDRNRKSRYTAKPVMERNFPAAGLLSKPLPLNGAKSLPSVSRLATAPAAAATRSAPVDSPSPQLIAVGGPRVKASKKHAHSLSHVRAKEAVVLSPFQESTSIPLSPSRELHPQPTIDGTADLARRSLVLAAVPPPVSTRDKWKCSAARGPRPINRCSVLQPGMGGGEDRPYLQLQPRYSRPMVGATSGARPSPSSVTLPLAPQPPPAQSVLPVLNDHALAAVQSETVVQSPAQGTVSMSAPSWNRHLQDQVLRTPTAKAASAPGLSASLFQSLGIPMPAPSTGANHLPSKESGLSTPRAKVRDPRRKGSQRQRSAYSPRPHVRADKDGLCAVERRVRRDQSRPSVPGADFGRVDAVGGVRPKPIAMALGGCPVLQDKPAKIKVAVDGGEGRVQVLGREGGLEGIEGRVVAPDVTTVVEGVFGTVKVYLPRTTSVAKSTSARVQLLGGCEADLERKFRGRFLNAPSVTRMVITGVGWWLHHSYGPTFRAQVAAKKALVVGVRSSPCKQEGLGKSTRSQCWLEALLKRRVLDDEFKEKGLKFMAGDFEGGGNFAILPSQGKACMEILNATGNASSAKPATPRCPPVNPVLMTAVDPSLFSAILIVPLEN